MADSEKEEEIVTKIVYVSDCHIPTFEQMQKIQEPLSWWTCERCWKKRHDVGWRTLGGGDRVCVCCDCFKLLDTGEKE